MNLCKFSNDWLLKYLRKKTQPDPVMLVLGLTYHTASLELAKGEYVEFAPLKGTFGPIRLSGNSLPVFEYRMFEKKLMEFVHVRVEVAKPSRISFQTTIESTTAPERHGEVIETKPKYREPFETLAYHLYQYFPFYLRADEPSRFKRTQNESETGILVHSQSTV